MYGDLKQTFIIQTLALYMQDVIATIKLQAQRLGVGITDDGVNSLAYEVITAGDGAYANLSFKQYLRMVDMGAGRGHPLGGLASMRTTLKSLNKTGFVQVKDKGRKPKKLYSPIAYGKLTWLENKLLSGYTDQAIEAIKSQLGQNIIEQ